MDLALSKLNNCLFYLSKLRVNWSPDKDVKQMQKVSPPPSPEFLERPHKGRQTRSRSTSLMTMRRNPTATIITFFNTKIWTDKLKLAVQDIGSGSYNSGSSLQHDLLEMLSLKKLWKLFYFLLLLPNRSQPPQPAVVYFLLKSIEYAKFCFFGQFWLFCREFTQFLVYFHRSK